MGEESLQAGARPEAELQKLYEVADPKLPAKEDGSLYVLWS
jgi:hypothetical protein